VESRTNSVQARYDRDMRSRVSLFASLLVVGFLVFPLATNAGGIPFFGPIIPQEGTQAVCAAGWGMIITVFNNLISVLITLAIVFVAPLMIAYSGFLYVINPVNPAGRSQANGILTRTIVGIVIALAGWMIVDAIMAVLYEANAEDSSGNAWGTWTSLITSGNLPPCIELKGSLAPAPPPTVGVVPEVTVNISNGAIVSTNAINILKSILRTAGLTSATITSGRRTSDDQTRVMYNNLQATNGVASQRALYGPNGDAVIDVYVVQKQAGAGETAIKAAMKQKIEQLGCYNVSNHCSSNDVFDVDPASISNGSAFLTALQNSSAVKNYIPPPRDPAYHIEL